MKASVRDRLRRLPIGPGAWIGGAITGLVLGSLVYAAVIEPDWDELRSERSNEAELREKYRDRQVQVQSLKPERARLLALVPALVPTAAASAAPAGPAAGPPAPLLTLVAQARAQGLQVERLLVEDGETLDKLGMRREGSVRLEGSFDQILSLLEGLSAGPEDALLWPLAFSATGSAGRLTLEAQVQAWRAATPAELADDRKARAAAPKAAASAAAASAAPAWGSRPAALPPRAAGLRDPFRAP